MENRTLFTQKYSPKKLSEIIGNDEQLTRIRQWALNWMNGVRKKSLLLYGAVGTGKSSTAHALKEEFDLELIEMGANELRNKDRVEKILTAATLAGSLSGRKKIFLIDDIDAFQRSDSGGIPAIAKLLRDSNQPIILTATNAWDKKIAPIRVESELLEFKKVNKSSIKLLLKKIAEKEKLVVDDARIDAIAENCNGDVCSSINDLQGMSTSQRDRDKDIFERIRSIFKSDKYEDAKKAVSGDVDYSILKLWVDENIPLEYENLDDRAMAYYYLSRADQLEGRIRNSHWGYLKYSLDFVSAGVALSKKSVYRKFTKYSFPNYLRQMASTVSTRAILKSIGKKIGEVTHTNSRDARIFIPIIKEFGVKDTERVMLHYKFTEDEMAFIMGTSVENLKIGKPKEESKEVKEETKIINEETVKKVTKKDSGKGKQITL
ncbi:MAG: replication factor C large subunit [Candidatus Micrarchaeota archaeon]|nr:replication factor C large subunit [Candidatus Micrarchaeota archaeon]